MCLHFKQNDRFKNKCDGILVRTHGFDSRDLIRVVPKEFKKLTGDQADKSACCVLGQDNKRNASTFEWFKNKEV